MKKVILITIAALLAATLAYAQPMGMGKMADKLSLTDQQQDQLASLKLKLERDLIKPQADLKTARLDLREIMMQTTIDEKAALKKQDQISALRADIARLRLQHKIAATKILTDEQRAQMKKTRRGMGDHRGRGRKGGDCCPMMGPGMGPMHGGMMWHDGMGGPRQMGPGMMNDNQSTDDKAPGK